MMLSGLISTLLGQLGSYWDFIGSKKLASILFDFITMCQFDKKVGKYFV